MSDVEYPLIRIDELTPEVLPSRTHVMPVMKGGVTTYMTVGQVLDLLVGAAPGSLDTLEELAAALADDANFAATITALINARLSKAGGAMTGDIDMAGNDLLNVVFGGSIAGPQLQGFMAGLTITNNVADAPNDLDFSAGSVASDTSPFHLMQMTAVTKRLDATFVAGNNGGMLDTGAVGNGIYTLYAIGRPDTGATDYLASLSSSAPVMPASYTWKVPIGRLARTAGANNAPRSFSQKGPTPWVAYTPTLTGFGTASGVSMISRQNGGNLEIMGKFTVGTPTAVEARMTLGFNGIDANVVSDAALIPSIRHCGSATYGSAVASSAFPAPLIESGLGYLTFGILSTAFAGLTKLNGSQFASAGWTVSLNASVPISGW